MQNWRKPVLHRPAEEFRKCCGATELRPTWGWDMSGPGNIFKEWWEVRMVLRPLQLNYFKWLFEKVSPFVSCCRTVWIAENLSCHIYCFFASFSCAQSDRPRFCFLVSPQSSARQSLVFDFLAMHRNCLQMQYKYCFKLVRQLHQGLPRRNSVYLWLGILASQGAHRLYHRLSKYSFSANITTECNVWLSITQPNLWKSSDPGKGACGGISGLFH